MRPPIAAFKRKLVSYNGGCHPARKRTSIRRVLSWKDTIEKYVDL